jgi:transposase-like protein
MTAVLAVITEGSRVSEVAEKFGVHRDTVHSWRARLAQERPTDDPRGGEKKTGRTPSWSLANQTKVSGITRTRLVGHQPDLHRPTRSSTT